MKKQLIAFSLQRLGREDKKTGYGVICDDGDLLLRVKKGETNTFSLCGNQHAL